MLENLGGLKLRFKLTPLPRFSMQGALPQRARRQASREAGLVAHPHRCQSHRILCPVEPVTGPQVRGGLGVRHGGLLLLAAPRVYL